MGVVEQDVLETLDGDGTLADHAERLAHQVAGVRHPGLGQHPLVGAVHLGELALERRLGGLGSRVPEPGRPAGVLVGADQVGLQPVDLADEPRQQGGRAAAEVVAANRQLVDPLEQHREPLTGVDDRVEHVSARPGVVQQHARQLHGRAHEELLIAAPQAALERGAHRVRATRRRHQHDGPLGSRALLDEPLESLQHHARLTGAGGPEHQQRPFPVRDRLALPGKQLVWSDGHV